MRHYKMREPIPDRCRSWTQKVKIEGQSVYLCVSEYDDGRPAGIFMDMAKCGTFARGVMGDLARAISVALQCGAGVETAVAMLRGADYPPRGPVSGSQFVKDCGSVTDWVAAELEAEYITKRQPQIKPQEGEGDVRPEAA